MAFVRGQGDFDLEDNGILQNSLNGLIIDDNGIVRDDELDLYRYVMQWTDSGFGGDKQSSTSTLLHRQNSFEDDLAPLGDESINISELEASKDDLSFDKLDNVQKENIKTPALMFVESRESTFDKPLNNNNDRAVIYDKKEPNNETSEDLNKRQLFSEDYYRQLHDLGILVDGVDLSRDSLNDLDELPVTSQMNENADGSHKDSQDLIGEYLESEIKKEQEENERGRNFEAREVIRRGSDLRKSESGYPFSRGSSRTVSSYSFPDDDEDYNDNRAFKGSGRGDYMHRQMLSMGGNDGEYGATTNSILPTLHNDLPNNERQRSRGGISGTRSAMLVGQDYDYKGLGFQTIGDISNSETQKQPDSHVRSVHTGDSRSSSRASHLSSGLDTSANQTSEQAVIKKFIKSTSQESIYDGGQLPQSPGEKTHSKRILPTPSSVEPSISFRVKGKNASSSGTRSMPVKPHHRTGSNVSHLSSNDYEDTFIKDETVDDVTEYLDESAKELTNRLTQEAQKRKQATELVQQLQKDYGSLLNKYALAELTIDQMRLEGKITLHADSPTPSQARSVVLSPVLSQHGQVMSLHQSPSHGVLMTSPPQGMMGTVTPITGNQRSRSQPNLLQGSAVSLLQSVSGSEYGQQMVSESSLIMVKASLMSQVQSMDERLESFCALIDGGDLTLEKQEEMFEEIKGDHDQVRRTYLQVKDEYNVLRRSGALNLDSQNFDQNKELEGHLFRLGMRFDEVHERVENNLKEGTSQRLPFHASGDKKKVNDGINGNHLTNEPVDNIGSTGIHGSGNANHADSVDTLEMLNLQQRVHKLREEYNANMDLYRKLKYTSNTPEGERQVEHIVRRLNEICTDMPDMFRLSPEIQARRDQMLRDNKLNVNERKLSVLEKLNKRQEEIKQQRESPVSYIGRGSHSSIPYSPSDERVPIILQQGSHNSDQESLRARLDGSSRSSMSSLLPDRMNQPASRGNSRGDQSSSPNNTDRPSSRSSHRADTSGHAERPSSRSGTQGVDESFSDSMSRGHDTSNPSLPRPRRHQHGMNNPKHSQVPDVSNGYRLPHNTTSDLENQNMDIATRGHQQNSTVAGAAGSLDGYEGALAALPGPGKMKQMTKQRAADDADSGFIGSMVGSGVGVHPGQLQQQQQEQQEQQQRTLQLTKAVDKSSTLSDQSLDVSDPTMRRSSTQQRRVKADRTGHKKSRATSEPDDTGREDSYDGEDDTVETSRSDVSLRRGRVKSQGEKGTTQESSEDSRDATLEGTYTDGFSESDVSTPRAASQSKPTTQENIASNKTLINSKMEAKPTEQSSQEQIVGVSTDKSESMDSAKATDNTSESLQTSERNDSTNHERLNPPLSHQQSQDLSTTNLFHTRERRASDGSRQINEGLTEFNRKKKQVQKQEREPVRQPEQPQPPLKNQRSPEAKHAGLDSDSHLHAENLDPVRRTKEYEDRSIGSDVEFGSSVTRGSSVASSNRLKALQEEIERLKEGVAKANERSNQPLPPQFYHIPTPAPALPQRQEPEYYDPFDDPYGFMRIPRRRANSFSGGREREWDEWYWTLPQNRQYDGGDIPLGYAAADAYADLPMAVNVPGQERNTRENIKNRLRRRRMDHRHSRSAQPGEPEPSASTEYVAANHQSQLIANQQSHLAANQQHHLTINQQPHLRANQQEHLRANQQAHVRVNQPSHLPANQQPHFPANQQQTGVGLLNPHRAAVYEYYAPTRYSASSMKQQMASHGYFMTPSGAKIYSSTGDEGDNEEELDIVDGSARIARTHSRPWYQIRRTPQPFTSGYAYRDGLVPPGVDRRTQSQEDVSRWNHSEPYLHARSGTNPAMSHRTTTQLCPMCGGTGDHTHSSHLQMSSPKLGPHRQMYSHDNIARESSPGGRSRRESRSPSHFTFDRSHSQSRYRVREYRHLSDTDEEENVSRRSRSLSRGRSRTMSHARSRDRRARRRSDSASDHSDAEETNLERSLSLSMDISRLTKKMLGTVSSELRRSKDMQKEFGSSFW